MYKSDAGGIFEKQGSMHNTFTQRTGQMFEVLKSIIIYIQGILLYRVSDHKLKMDIDNLHKRYMDRYDSTYSKYKLAFKFLDEEKYENSMNIAREAVKEFDALTLEIDEFMKDNEYRMKDINKSCYDLKYNLEDESCMKMFPNLLETVSFQPYL
jgi:hypothetical protein